MEFCITALTPMPFFLNEAFPEQSVRGIFTFDVEYLSERSQNWQTIWLGHAEIIFIFWLLTCKASSFSATASYFTFIAVILIKAIKVPQFVLISVLGHFQVQSWKTLFAREYCPEAHFGVSEVYIFKYRLTDNLLEMCLRHSPWKMNLKKMIQRNMNCEYWWKHYGNQGK